MLSKNASHTPMDCSSLPVNVLYSPLIFFAMSSHGWMMQYPPIRESLNRLALRGPSARWGQPWGRILSHPMFHAIVWLPRTCLLVSSTISALSVFHAVSWCAQILLQYIRCQSFNIHLFIDIKGGFFGNTDLNSEALAQKRSLLVSEGVQLDSQSSLPVAGGSDVPVGKRRRSKLSRVGFLVRSECLHVFWEDKIHRLLCILDVGNVFTTGYLVLFILERPNQVGLQRCYNCSGRNRIKVLFMLAKPRDKTFSSAM